MKKHFHQKNIKSLLIHVKYIFKTRFFFFHLTAFICYLESKNKTNIHIHGPCTNTFINVIIIISLTKKKSLFIFSCESTPSCHSFDISGWPRQIGTLKLLP